MSKTVSKKLDQKVNASNILKALKMMDIQAKGNENIRLYAGQKEMVSISLSKEELKKLGIQSAYSTGIGININEAGEANLRYDHANAKAAELLSGLMPGLNQIGSAEAEIQGYLSKGFELRPHIDLENKEFGVFLESKSQGQQHIGNTWADSDNKEGGLW